MGNKELYYFVLRKQRRFYISVYIIHDYSFITRTESNRCDINKTCENNVFMQRNIIMLEFIFPFITDQKIPYKLINKNLLIRQKTLNKYTTIY